MKTMVSVAALGLLVLSLFNVSPALAEQYVYKSQCVTTQSEDISRAIQGSIFLALRADHTVAKSNISVKLKKIPQPKVWITETEMLDGLGFSFDHTDLSMSVGGTAEGHACLAPHLLTIAVSVTRKDGTVQSNTVSQTINIPGSYATSTKVKETQLIP